MKVYLLFETKDSDEFGFGRRDDVLNVYAKRSKAEKALEDYTKTAEKEGLDYTYCVIPEEVK